jgi:hypothetical protein
MAKSKTSSVTAVAYKLDVRRGLGASLRFDFVIQDEKQNEFTLRVDAADTSTALIQKVMRRLADLWPARDITVLVNENDIVDVQS